MIGFSKQDIQSSTIYLAAEFKDGKSCNDYIQFPMPRRKQNQGEDCCRKQQSRQSTKFIDTIQHYKYSWDLTYIQNIQMQQRLVFIIQNKWQNVKDSHHCKHKQEIY
ncbi:unnamed protein product [Paramecium octaurelia]|uniref:Uncharacterized protein n=1 Tax=Paramecium octaurelia TaxID=43137 RepID=A0A8S1XP16_PAROT|nr:unnamed protein product [Paramecium octaurelia]